MFTGSLWAATLERAVRTFAQALAVVLGAGAINILDVPWVDAVGVAAGAAVLSVLTSIAAGAVTSTPGPSFTGTETTALETGPSPAAERSPFS